MAVVAVEVSPPISAVVLRSMVEGLGGLDQQAVSLGGREQDFHNDPGQGGVQPEDADVFVVIGVRQSGQHPEIVMVQGFLDFILLVIELGDRQPALLDQFGGMNAGEHAGARVVFVADEIYDSLHGIIFGSARRAEAHLAACPTVRGQRRRFQGRRRNDEEDRARSFLAER